MISVIDLEKENDLDIKLTGILLGQGSFGIVMKSEWRGKDVAIKRFTAEKSSFAAELKNLIRVNHENIIQCLAYKQSNNLIVMEYAENGSLHQLLHAPKYSKIHYNLAHALSWALQCAKGVQYLHNFKPKLIIHRDLKPLNILLKENFSKIKICDFGTACDMKTFMTQTQGSISWMAPEVMKGNKYNEKCDVFSWGIILWELFSRKVPHSTDERNEIRNDDNSNESRNLTTYSLSPYAIIWAIASGQRPKLLKNCPKVFEKLIESCWQAEPENRPTMNEIVEKMELYFNIVKDKLIPIDSSSVKSEELQSNYLSFDSTDEQVVNRPNSLEIGKYTVTLKKPNQIPDNVNLEPCSEIVIGNQKENETPVIKHYINFTPINENEQTFIKPLNEMKEDDKLKILKLEKLSDDGDNESVNFDTATETDSSSTLNNSSNQEYNDDENNDPSQGCISSGINSISTLSKLVNGFLKTPSHEQSTFYVHETSNYCEEVGELEKSFSTLKPCNKLVKESNNQILNHLNKNSNNEHIQINVTKRSTKNHRSEIEINNCNKIQHQLNSSASSTISSTSLVLNKVDDDDKLNRIQPFRSTEDVNNFFSRNNSTNGDDSNLDNSSDFKLGSSYSSFESIDKEQIKEIEKEYPNCQIKYNYGSNEGVKKKKGYMKQIKKVFNTTKNSVIKLSPTDN